MQYAHDHMGMMMYSVSNGN